MNACAAEVVGSSALAYPSSACPVGRRVAHHRNAPKEDPGENHRPGGLNATPASGAGLGEVNDAVFASTPKQKRSKVAHVTGEGCTFDAPDDPMQLIAKVTAALRICGLPAQAARRGIGECGRAEIGAAGRCAAPARAARRGAPLRPGLTGCAEISGDTL